MATIINVTLQYDGVAQSIAVKVQDLYGAPLPKTVHLTQTEPAKSFKIQSIDGLGGKILWTGVEDDPVSHTVDGLKEGDPVQVYLGGTAPAPARTRKG